MHAVVLPESTFAPSLAWQLLGIQMAVVSGKMAAPFFSLLVPNVAIFAIPLFRREVGRIADARIWPISQHNPLNAAKNTERSQQYETL